MPTIDDTTYGSGRVWTTTFADAAADAVWADVTNMTYTTDSATPVVKPTSPGSTATVFTKATDVADVDVLVKWRPVAGSGYSTSNIAMNTYARKTGADYWINSIDFSTPKMQVFVPKNGVSPGGTSYTTLTISNTTTYRYTRTRIVEDVALTKTWFAGDAEPDWQRVFRCRAPIGLAGFSSSLDNPESGIAGLELRYGGYVSELTITELVRADDNLLFHPLPSIIDGSSVPIGWYKDVGGSDTMDVTSVADSLGATRNVFHINKVSTDRGAFWTQWLWASAPNVFQTRSHPHPFIVWPPESVVVSLWSKAVDSFTSGTLAAVIDMYMYDDAGSVLNFNWPNYYGTLGPEGGPVSIGGPAVGHGTGTWDWTYSEWEMQLPPGITSMKFQVGFHDPFSTGEIWFADVRLRDAAENVLPAAAFDASTSPAVVIDFDATGSTDDGIIQSYIWDFGDDTTGSGVTVSHVYATAGTYTVTLTVTDNRGGTDSVSQDVTAVANTSNCDCMAGFAHSINIIHSPLSAPFSARQRPRPFNPSVPQPPFSL